MTTPPFVYRKPRAKPPFVERLLVCDASDVLEYNWKWYAASKIGPSRCTKTSHRTAAAAEAATAAATAKLVAEGWKPIVDWPGEITPAEAAELAKPKPAAKPKKPKPLKRITLAKLTIHGRVAKISKAELAAVARKVALPADWCKLVQTYGVRMFANLVRITKPAKIVAETKRWVTFWTVDHKPAWTNFAALVPDPSKLVIVASSSNGDMICHTGTRYVVFPRGSDVAVGLADLAEVFGWFLRSIEDSGDRPRATYQPESYGY